MWFVMKVGIQLLQVFVFSFIIYYKIKRMWYQDYSDVGVYFYVGGILFFFNQFFIIEMICLNFVGNDLEMRF